MEQLKDTRESGRDFRARLGILQAQIYLSIYGEGYPEKEAYFSLLTIARRLERVLGAKIVRELFEERLTELSKQLYPKQ